MQNNMQIWLESSTTTFNLNSHDEGVYLVSDLDGLTSLPEIRTSQGVNAGTDGGWTSAQAFDARLISLNIVIANEDESIVESKRRTLNSLLAQSRKESLKLHFISEAGMEYVISVRVTNVSGALSNILKKQNLLIQMRADDPIIYGAQGGEGADAILTVQQAQGGFEIPFDIPLIIDGGTDKVNVENLGSEEVYPVIKMTGPLHNPTVVNETQNAEIGVNADLGDMEWRGYKSAEIYGNTTQTTLSGKNLFNFKELTDYIGVNGVTRGTATYTDNSITLTATSNDCFTKYGFPSIPPVIHVAQNTNMVLSWKTSTTGTSKGRIYVFGNDNGSATIIGSGGTPDTNQVRTFNTGNYTEITFRLGVSISGDSITYSDIQLEVGSTATDYEQYCGGVQSPNPDFPQVVNTVSGEQTVQIVGKNLWGGFDSDIAINGGGKHFVNKANGDIEVDAGTATSTAFSLQSAQANQYNRLVELPVGTYTLSGGDSILKLDVVRTTGTRVVQDTGAGATFTLTEKTKVFIRVAIDANKTVASDTTVHPMLQIGNQATTYEPYQGQSYEINLGGHNLCPNEFEQGGISNTTGTNNSDTAVRTTNYATVKENTTYTASTNKGTNIAIRYYKSDGTYIGAGTTASASGNTFTTPALTARVRFVITNTTDTSQNFMLNEGSTALLYEPYTTYAYELAKIGTYQDYIYKSGDDWYIHKAVGKKTFTGDVSENWSDATTYYSCSASLGSNSSNALTNYYTYGGVGTPKTFWITTNAFRTNDLRTDLATYKTWLSTHNVTLYYALATPTDTEITDSELVGQLEALLDYAPWYGDDQNVFLIPSAGADGTLILGPHNEPKPADVVLIDTQLKTVTLNGQNAYPLLKDGSSFFTLAPGDNTMYLTSDVSSDTGKAEIKFKQGFISI